MESRVVATDVDADSEYRRKRTRAILSAWAGFGVDAYSIYIVTSTLLPALVYFQGDMSAETKFIFAGMTLAVTLLGRPIGGIIFGHLADRLSRRTIGSITIYGFGTISLLIACLPGANLVGATVATSLLILLRFVEGVFLGGEYSAATPMALEYAAPSRRGLVSGIVQCSASGGPILVGVMNIIALAVAPYHGPDSPYVQWGWRIPFVFGFVVAMAVAWFLRRTVDDSEVWKAAQHEAQHSSLKMLLKGRSGRAFVQAWGMMTGAFFLITIGSGVLPQFVLSSEGFTAGDLARTQLITSFFAMLTYIFFGWLSDHIGRKPALYVSGLLAGTVAPWAMTQIGNGNAKGFVLVTIASVMTQVFYLGPLGVLPAYINERFATSIRSSGWGVAYGTAVIIPSFFPYYMVWLGKVMPFVYTPIVLMAIGALIIIVATSFGPETQGIDLRAAGSAGVQPRSRVRKDTSAALLQEGTS